METEPRTAAELSAAAAKHIRSICHLSQGVYGAPETYEVVANLKLITNSLDTVLNQLQSGLLASLEAGKATDSTGDPVENVNKAIEHLAQARTSAQQVAEALDTTQEKLAWVAWEPKS